VTAPRAWSGISTPECLKDSDAPQRTSRPSWTPCRPRPQGTKPNHPTQVERLLVRRVEVEARPSSTLADKTLALVVAVVAQGLPEFVPEVVGVGKQ
jgi:hypothetical protein